jgi:ATP-dependent Clp protease ATP-binding subunit ClpX
MAKKEEINCSFCGRPKSEVDILIAGVTGHICENCIEQAHQIVGEEGKGGSTDEETDFELLKPIEIKTRLDELKSLT